MWRTTKGSTELHVRARIEHGQLVEKEIVCPRSGDEAGKFEECDGAPCAILACSQCGNGEKFGGNVAGSSALLEPGSHHTQSSPFCLSAPMGLIAPLGKGCAEV